MADLEYAKQLIGTAVYELNDHAGLSDDYADRVVDNLEEDGISGDDLSDASDNLGSLIERARELSNMVSSYTDDLEQGALMLAYIADEAWLTEEDSDD
jgi:hypothetical protein